MKRINPGQWWQLAIAAAIAIASATAVGCVTNRYYTTEQSVGPYAPPVAYGDYDESHNWHDRDWWIHNRHDWVEQHHREWLAQQ
jgi:hypothetical protein